MPKGGARPGAGRPRGSKDKTAAAREAITAHAMKIGAEIPERIARMTPIEVLLTAMNLAWAAGDLKGAAGFAREAAPYIHPKLSNQVQRIEHDFTGLTDEQLDREIVLTIEAARSGEGEAPRQIESAGILHIGAPTPEPETSGAPSAVD